MVFANLKKTFLCDSWPVVRNKLFDMEQIIQADRLTHVTHFAKNSKVPATLWQLLSGKQGFPLL